MRLLYLGDIHRNFNLIKSYVENYSLSDVHIIQVGDFGVGFREFEEDYENLERINKILIENNVFVWAIRGNHDYKPYFDNDPFNFSNIKLVKDYTVLNLCNKKILCVGGAQSVDRLDRIKRNKKKFIKCWWEDEVFVLNTDKLNGLKDIDIVVTHTAPDYCPPDNKLGFSDFVNNIIKETGDDMLKADLLIERKLVTDMHTILKMNNNPITNWYYGHFHDSKILNIYGIEHRMLGIGELWEEKEKDYYV